MTRKTKLHSLTQMGLRVIYRDLNLRETTLLLGIKNETVRCEMAAKLAVIEPTDTKGIPIGVMLQVGNNTLINSTKVASDKELCEIIIKEYRAELGEDSSSPLALIAEILKVLPGQSFTDLLELTYEDIIELVCLCEKIKGVRIFAFGEPAKKKGNRLVNTRDLPDDGKSLKEKMAELNSILGNKK